jgi:putative transposase
MSARKPYPSDLTALQRHNIEHLFPQPKTRAGRKRTYDRKDIVDAVFYLARTGCQWRMLPHDFPPWKTVSYYFYTWRDAGV